MAGLRPSTVRGLLDARKIVMLGQPVRLPGHAHRAALVDALRLATLRRLQDSGLTDAQAIYVLDQAVDPLLGGLCLAGVSIPLAMLRGRLHGRAFHVVPDGSGTPDVYSTPSGYPAPDDAPVAITINLAVILADVLRQFDARRPKSTAANDTQHFTGGGCAPRRTPNPSTTAGVAPAITGVTP